MELFCGKKKIADNVIIYNGMCSKAKGLRFKRARKNFAYIFPIRYESLEVVDTFFVLSKLDIIFLDKNFRALGHKKGVRPCRFVFPKKGTRFVLEALKINGIKKGDKLKLVKKGIKLCTTINPGYKPRH